MAKKKMIDDSSATYNYNPWEKFGFRWTEQEKAEVIRDLPRFLEKANANYRVEMERQQRPDGSQTNRFELIRSDTRKIIGTKTVSSRYRPLCPQDMAEAIAPLVEQGWATPDAFFTMGDGEKEVLVCRLDAGQIPAMGDLEKIDGQRLAYVSVRNYHGQAQASGSLHFFRVICENTEAAACASWAWKIRHTGNPAERMKESVQAWEEVKEQTRKLAERYTLFADAKISALDAKGLVQDILEMDSAAVKMREDDSKGNIFFGKQLPGASTAGIRERDEILAAFNRPSKGTNGRTLLDLRNAVTDTLSHWAPEKSRVDAQTLAERHFDIGGVRYKVERRADLVLAGAAGLTLEAEAEAA